MGKDNIVGRYAFILTGSIITFLSIHSIYIASLDKQDFKAYSGKPLNIEVKLKKEEPNRHRHDLLNNDSIFYVEMYIMLENSDKQFVIGNQLSNQFILLKRLIQEADVLTIRARKDLLKKNEYRVYQIDSNRRNDIVSIEETTDHTKGSLFFISLGIAGILFGIFGKIKRFDYEDDD